MNRIPNHWARAMTACGFTHRGLPSLSKLADEAGLSIETARRLVYGIGAPSAETVAKAKKALRGAPVESWVGMGEVSEIYTGPSASRLLDARQRAAITELINAIVAPPDANPLALVPDYDLLPGADYYDLAANQGQTKQADVEDPYDADSQDDGSMEPA